MSEGKKEFKVGDKVWYNGWRFSNLATITGYDSETNEYRIQIGLYIFDVEPKQIEELKMK